MDTLSTINIKINSCPLRYQSLLKKLSQEIGDTPMQTIRYHSASRVGLFAKYEFYNPWHTIKDRVAFSMILDLLAKDEFSDKKPILEYTGGSLGIALAHICKRLQLKLELVLPDYLSESYFTLMKKLGVQVHKVDKDKGFWEVIDVAIEMGRTNRYHFLYQHENGANPWFHQHTTGNEITKSLKLFDRDRKNLVMLVGSIGTGGTLRGISDALIDEGFRVELAVTCPKELPYGSQEAPNGLPKFAGSGGLGLGRKQRFLEEIEQRIHTHHLYSYDQAIQGSKKYFEQTGIAIGSSAGANYLTALRFYQEYLTKGNCHIVTVFPSLLNQSELNMINT